MPLLNVALVPAPHQVVVRLTGEADLSTEALLSDALRQAAGLDTRQVVVDVAGVRFWDCSGLHALVAVTSELAMNGRSCRVVGAGPATRRLIRVAALTDRLELDGPLSNWVVQPREADFATSPGAVPGLAAVGGPPGRY